MGNDINFFITRDLKRYTPSKDQSIFGPIIRLPIHILTKVGLDIQIVIDHIEATEGIDPYLSTPPLPSQNILPSTAPNQPEQSAAPSSTTLSNASRLKQLVSPKKGHRIKGRTHITDETHKKCKASNKAKAPKEAEPAKKQKLQQVVSSDDNSESNQSSGDSDLDSAPIAILKRRKIKPTFGQMRDRTDTVASQKALIVLGVPTDAFATTLSSYSNTASVLVSSQHGESSPS